jgi:hypothetical protein
MHPVCRCQCLSVIESEEICMWVAARSGRRCVACVCSYFIAVLFVSCYYAQHSSTGSIAAAVARSLMTCAATNKP